MCLWYFLCFDGGSVRSYCRHQFLGVNCSCTKLCWSEGKPRSGSRLVWSCKYFSVLWPETGFPQSPRILESTVLGGKLASHILLELACHLEDNTANLEVWRQALVEGLVWSSEPTLWRVDTYVSSKSASGFSLLYLLLWAWSCSGVGLQGISVSRAGSEGTTQGSNHRSKEHHRSIIWSN